MKNIKTYEGFLDIFKSKEKNQNKLVEEYISVVQDMTFRRSEIVRTVIGPKNEIDFESYLSILPKPYIVKFKISVTDDTYSTKEQLRLLSNIRVTKCAADETKPKWTTETEKRWIDSGAIKKNDNEIYSFFIDEKPIVADVELIERLFDLCERRYEYTTGLRKDVKTYSPSTKKDNKDKDDNDSGSFLGSAAIGYITDNPLLGGALGGDYSGGLVGSGLRD
jgi:hypothetical protein